MMTGAGAGAGNGAACWRGDRRSRDLERDLDLERRRRLLLERPLERLLEREYDVGTGMIVPGGPYIVAGIEGTIIVGGGITEGPTVGT
jgi:hypothetical protein